LGKLNADQFAIVNCPITANAAAAIVEKNKGKPGNPIRQTSHVGLVDLVLEIEKLAQATVDDGDRVAIRRLLAAIRLG